MTEKVPARTESRVVSRRTVATQRISHGGLHTRCFAHRRDFGFIYVICSMVDPASVRATGCGLCSEKAHTHD